MSNVSKLLHQLQRGSRHGRTLKKVAIIFGVVAIAFVISVIILIIMAINWLVTNNDLKDKGQEVMGQAQQITNPLNLESYISSAGQVDTAKLQETFNNLPAAAQEVWLNQFKSQLDSLREQAGISPETIQSFTALYGLLQG